jgi:hypothetical protein
MEGTFRFEGQPYTYVIYKSIGGVDYNIQTKPSQSNPSTRPSELTDEWLSEEMLKAYHEDVERAHTGNLRMAIVNVQKILKGETTLILFNNHMIGKVDIYVDLERHTINMLFLCGFSRHRGSGNIVIKAVAHYATRIFGKHARIMAINPLSTLYKRLFEYDAFFVPLIKRPGPVTFGNITDAIPHNFSDPCQTDMEIRKAMEKTLIDGHLAPEPHEYEITREMIGFGATMSATRVLEGISDEP